jgi:uncharacterized membrane protein (DUF441 family)
MPVVRYCGKVAWKSVMPSLFAAPMLLAVMIGLIVALLLWGLVRVHGRQGGDAALETHDELIIGFVVLAAFVLGVFLAYFATGIGL